MFYVFYWQASEACEIQSSEVSHNISWDTSNAVLPLLNFFYIANTIGTTPSMTK